ncbi:MAG: helix-turn-helix domain-containing protein [Clostridia bacterium]|nr:helix-turn-helix domain-containing protein [Clostridia bacterium]
MRTRAQRFDPRQYMRGENFEVFHYRETDPYLPEAHYHNFYEVYYLLEGDVEYWIEGRTYSLHKGEILLIKPMEFHRPVIKDKNVPYERIVVWLDKAYLEEISSDTPLDSCFDFSSERSRVIKPSVVKRTEITALLSELVKEYYSNEYASKICAFGALVRFMAELNRISLSVHSDTKATEVESPLVLGVLDYIGEHYNEELSLDLLASRFFVSKYHLSHEFSKATGTGVYRYILLKRLISARGLLLEGVSATQTATLCGFKDYTSFFKAFKAEYGISPRECSSER